MADNLSAFCCHIVASDGIGLGKPKVKVIDISIILYRETKGDIRPFARFVVSILKQNAKFL